MLLSVKDTREGLIGLNELALYFAKAFSDGVQATDFLSFYAQFRDDAEFRGKLQAAWEGRHNIKAEVRDLNVEEGVELAQLQLGYLPKLVKALQGDEKAPE